MRRQLSLVLVLLRLRRAPSLATESVEFYLERSPDLSIAHLKCMSSEENVQDGGVPADGGLIVNSYERCCTKILNQILEACSEYSFSMTDDSMNDFCAASLGRLDWSLRQKEESFRTSWMRKCSSKLARVPLPYEELYRGSVKSYYMNAPIFNPSQRSSDLFPLDSTLWNYNLINGTHKWVNVMSPFLEKVTTHENQCDIDVMLSSNLSTDGGMHRVFSQSIQVRGTIPHDGSDKRGRFRISGSFHLHLPITAETFLDLDDPFQDDIKHACKVFPSKTKDSNTCSVSILPPASFFNQSDADELISQKQYIDIEQPEFDSPQHVLLLKLDFSIMDADPHIKNFDISFQFSPVIHMRYQMPLSTSAIQSKLYIPSPYFYKGVINLLSNPKPEMRDKNFSICFHRNIESSSISDQSPKTLMYPIYIDCATGYDNHHDYVVLVTTMAFLLGTWILFRSMSRISLWI